MKSILSVFWLAAFGLFVSGCEEPIHEDLTPSFDLMEYLAAFPSDAGASNAKARPRPSSWADCERFAGVVTAATFDPANGNFDELYMGGNVLKMTCLSYPNQNLAIRTTMVAAGMQMC